MYFDNSRRCLFLNTYIFIIYLFINMIYLFIYLFICLFTYLFIMYNFLARESIVRESMINCKRKNIFVLFHEFEICSFNFERHFFLIHFS